MLGLGFLSLILLDADITVDHDHESHTHHTGLNHLFYHIVNWFGVADHKVSIVPLKFKIILPLAHTTSNVT